MKKFISLFLFIALLLPAFLFTAFSITYTALGDVYYTESDVLSPGLTYSKLYSKSGDSNQRSFLFEFSPNEGTLPIVEYGSHLYGRSRLSTLIKDAESKGYDVVSGINADFFSFYTGIPMSALITDGRILSSDAGRNAFGFKSDGGIIIGCPDIALNMTVNGKTYNIDHYNKYPTIYGVYALSDDYSVSTKSTFDSREIIVSINGNPGLISGFSGEVVSVGTSAQDSEIPEGCVAITIPDSLSGASAYSAIKKGDYVLFSMSIAKEWSDVTLAVGGGDIIVEDGKICENISDEAHEKQKNPRNAIGVKADGNIIVFAIDGKQNNYSAGLTLDELALTMKELGCVRALNLDGGGSTTVSVKFSGEDKHITVNSPSDGAERSVSNAVLFINTLSNTGVPSSLRIYPNTAYVLKGSSVQLSAAVRDTAYKIIESIESTSINFTCDESIGSMEGAVFNAKQTGKVKINASALFNGTPLTGAADITVVDSLTSLLFSESEISIPTKKTYQISITGYLDGIKTYIDPACLKWSFDEGNIATTDQNILAASDIAIIDKSGVIRLNSNTPYSSVTLSAKYGDLTAEITINSGLEPIILNKMEYGFADVFYSDSVTLDSAPALIQGNNSLAFEGEELVYLEPKTIRDGAEYFTIWTDSVPLMTSCYITALDADGKEVIFPYAVDKEYTFRNLVKLKAIVPEDVKQPLTILSPFSATLPVELKLDAFTVNFGDDARSFADIGGHWSYDNIMSMYETSIINGVLEDGKLYYYPERNLTRAEFAKMLVSYKGLNLTKYEDIKLPFDDIKTIPEWALPYVKAAIGEKLMNGKSMPDGKLNFAANDNITRTEVMYVFGSMISGFNPIELSFADKNDIPKWAYEKLSVAFAAGVITGYNDNTLKPLNNITRAEIASVFNKMMKK